MRACITGIRGFVGGHLAEHLLALGGWEVWGLVRNCEDPPAHLRTAVHLVTADLLDQAALAQAIAEVQPDVVFHLAGQPFVPESFRDPAGTLATNVLGALNLLLAIRDHRRAARVIVVGSTEEYGQIAPHDLPIDEETPLNPTSPYGVSKAAQGLLALQYHFSDKLDIVRLRPFNHIGPRQSERFVTAAFARQIARIERGLDPPLVRVGNLSARRDFSDVRDIVAAYALAAQYGIAGQVYNIGAGRSTAISDILALLCAASTAQVEVQINPDLLRPVDIPEVVCDATRFRTQTGWTPRYTLEATLRDILADWRLRIA